MAAGPRRRSPKWFLLDHEGSQRGPYAGVQLAAMLDSGVLDEKALVWRAGVSGWTQLAHARAVLLEGALDCSLEMEARCAAARPPQPRADGVARLSHDALLPAGRCEWRRSARLATTVAHHIGGRRIERRRARGRARDSGGLG